MLRQLLNFFPPPQHNHLIPAPSNSVQPANAPHHTCLNSIKPPWCRKTNQPSLCAHPIMSAEPIVEDVAEEVQDHLLVLAQKV